MAVDGDVAVNVDVFWVSTNPEFITRGYYDCAFLEAILRNELWEPVNKFTFTNHDVRGDFPHHDGAVVCFSGMGNAANAEWLIAEIDKMPWALVIIIGNEMWDFPWRDIPETPTRRVWVMNPTPEHAGLSNRIPGGWYPNTREEIAAHSDRAINRQLDWFFAGQVTNVRRKACVQELRRMGNGRLIETDRFLGGVPSTEYAEYEVMAKAVPSPSGPMTLDANRPLAAMEAGCVPILDLRKPQDPQFDYWELVFGPGYPMPVVYEWNEIRARIDDIVKAWPQSSNTVFAWWQQWKRRTIQQLHDDIAAVSGLSPQRRLVDRITAVITSSPIPSHPDVWCLEETIKSVRERLPDIEIVVVFDGVRPEQVELAGDYHEYIRRCLWKANFEWHNVLPVVMPAWGHQANSTRYALQFVNTPNMLFMEHDTPIVGEVPWDELIDQIDGGVANVIRLHQDVEIHADHERVMLDRVPQNINGVPMRRSAAWWQRPHLASTDFYRHMIQTHFHPDSRTMIEDRIYSIMWIDCADRRHGWDRWKVWVYTPEGDIRRSSHLDGRAGAPKFDMLFEPESHK